MKKFPLYFILLLTTSYGFTLKAQAVTDIINSYTSIHPIEQVYVQLDNSLYSTGDTIWFKAYVLANTLPSAYSANLYADWYDASGTLLAHQIYPIDHAGAHGQFNIPAGYRGDHIHLLAYTKWMLNEDKAYLFHERIHILPDKSALPPVDSIHEKQKLVLQFFPEGGSLVEGILNKIAFKATDQYGIPLDLNGLIRSGQGDSVTAFSSSHDGMGYFYLSPLPGSHYQAVFKHLNGQGATIDLPEAQASGIAMEVITADSFRRVIIRKSRSNSSQFSEIYLLTTMGGYSKFLSTIRIPTQDSISIPVDIPVKDFDQGIVTFTVLDKNWNPLAERISFVNNHLPENQMNGFSLKMLQTNLEKRGLNEIEILNEDTLDKNLSIAITDGDIPREGNTHILSYLLLSGQLRGRIENPDYYFLENSKTSQRNLDLVMLTNGWRKYHWQAIVSGKTGSPSYSRDSAYFFLQGRFDSKPGKIPKQISLMIKNKDILNESSYTLNSSGYFADSSLTLVDTTRVDFRGPQKEKGLDIKYNQLPKAAFQFDPLAETIPPISKTTQNILYSSLTFYKNTLPEVVVHGFKKKFDNKIDSLESKYESPGFHNAWALKNVYLGNNPALSTYGANDFRGFILAQMGIDISSVYPVNYSQDLQYYLDEQPVPKDAATQIPITDIAFMKYYRYLVFAPGGGSGAAASGGGVAPLSRNGGVLAIYTKRGFDFETSRSPANPSSSVIVGYTISREFYTPDYSNRKDKKNKSTVTDNRKTLYWDPQLEIKAGDKKNHRITFFNNDFASRIRIVIEGIKSDGTPLHIEKTLK